MKKLRGIMAILAATALIFGTVACSDGGGNDNNNNKTPTDQSDPTTGGGGSGTSDPTSGGGGSQGGSSLEAIADSWNFVSQADSVAWVSAVKSAADPSKADGTATLTSNVDILGADSKLTLSLLEGSAAAFKYSTALGTTGNSAASFSYVDPACGLRIKGTAIKIAGVQGKAKITVSWIGVKDNRAIAIFEGAVDDSTPLIKKATDTSKPEVSVTGNSGPMTGYIQDDLVHAVDYTSEAKDLYLVAGNNVYIKSIAIEDAADVTENTVSVFIPNFDDGSLEETGKTVSIGYADSISSSDLITALKADTSLADTFAQVLTFVQAEVNEDLVAGGAESGAVTVTADLIDYWFFAKADWSKIIDEDESNDPTPVTTIAAADEVVVAFTRSASLDSKVEAAIAAASGTEIYFTELNFDDVPVADYKDAAADWTAEDGTWTIVHGVSAAKVAEASAKSYNEDTTYTKRIQMKGDALKLKVGGTAPVVLRVDGGSGSGTGSNRTLTAKGTDSATWTSFKGSADGKVCVGFLTVTPDSDGYVTLSADNNYNVYGVKVVESTVDVSGVVLGTSSSSYGDVSIVFNPESASVTAGEAITASASVTKSVTPLMANGLEGTKTDTALTTFNFYVDDGTEPVETLPSDTPATHTVKAVLYNEADGVKTEDKTVTASSAYSVLEAGVTYCTVTFDKNAEGAVIGDTTTQSVKASTATALLTAETLGLSNAGYIFSGWATAADGEVVYADGAEITVTDDTTLYAVWAAAITVSDGVLTLNADSYAYALTKENLEDGTGNNAWSTASAEALANTTAKAGKTYFTTSANVVNMSKAERSITLKVNNVAAVDVHVFDSNGGRDYTVKIGNNDAVTYQSVKNAEGNIIKTNTDGEVTIVIAGVSKSVYPVGVILYKEEPSN